MRHAYQAAVSVKFLINSRGNLGLYLHIPFCNKKCRYCDFYSACAEPTVIDRYTKALIKNIEQWGGKISRPIDTIYLGGGTPALLSHRLSSVIDAVKKSFEVLENSEITIEINPFGDSKPLLENAAKAGINRLSVGIQSADENELKALGRTHSFADAISSINSARELGFDNISVDLMLGLPDSQNNSRLKYSLDEILKISPEHISAYILKIEQNTAFYNQIESLNLPDDDQISGQYLFMCEHLEKNGYSHYEISNFAKKGYESRHNLKYWNLEDYLGLGPSAHSFFEGKRFFYERDLKAFISGNEPIPDGVGGDCFEYIMLGLRLSKGINTEEFKRIYNREIPQGFYKKSRLFKKAGYMKIEKNSYSLTNEGMLLSNSIISQLLEEIGE